MKYLFNRLAFDISPAALSVGCYYMSARNIGAELGVVGLDRKTLKLDSTGDFDCGTRVATDRVLLQRIATCTRIALAQIEKDTLLSSPQFMAFFPSHKAAKAAQVQFAAQGLSVEIVLGNTLNSDNTETLTAKSFEHHIEAYKAGRLQGLIVVGRLGRGFDHPQTALIVIAFATKSRSRWVQACGRASRPFPGKVACNIIDFGENFETFGTPDMSAAEAIAFDNRPPPVPREGGGGGRGETQLNTTPSRIQIGTFAYEDTITRAMVRHVWQPGTDHPRTYVTFWFPGGYKHTEFYGIGYTWWPEQQIRCRSLLMALGIEKLSNLDVYEFENLIEQASKNCNLKVLIVRFPDYSGQLKFQVVKIGDVQFENEFNTAWNYFYQTCNGDVPGVLQ